MANDTLKDRILAYVSYFMDMNGYAPSYREIGSAMGVRSTSTVYEYVKKLEADGKLRTRAGRPRGLALGAGVPRSDPWLSARGGGGLGHG